MYHIDTNNEFKNMGVKMAKRKSVVRVEDKTYSELGRIVGSQYVSNREVEKVLYSTDRLAQTGILYPGKVDYIVMPETTEEVQAVVQFANREKMPILPLGAGTVAKGITIPRGGIVMDLRRMNHVTKINEDSMYALVEAGTTWVELERELRKSNSHLHFGRCWGPPTSTILGSAMNWGMPNHGYMTGTSSDQINGLEVVLPTGEIIQTNCSSASPGNWIGRPPLPDLAGLFIGWEGVTGIVTKLAVKLWPKNLIKPLFSVIKEYKDGWEKMAIPVMRANLGLRWLMTFNAGMLSAGSLRPWQEVPAYPENDVGFDFLLMTVLTAYAEKEMEVKIEALKDIVEKAGGATIAEDVLLSMGDSLFPTFVSGLKEGMEIGMDMGEAFVTGILGHNWVAWGKHGGAEYTGGFLPIENTVPYYYAQKEMLANKYGRCLEHFNRFMYGGHYNNVRCVFFNSNRHDPKEVELTMNALRDASKIYMDYGGVLYKLNEWQKEMVKEKMDPNTLAFMQRIQKFLDPNNIMNPPMKW